MNVNFFDSNGNHTPQPKENVRIEEIIATPYPDRFRVRLDIKVTPFQERPNLIIVMHDENERVIAELNVIATMHAQMEFTLHIRGVDDPAGTYTITAELFYETRLPPQDEHVIAFEIPRADEEIE